MPTRNTLILACVLALVAGAIFYLESSKPDRAVGVSGTPVATSTVHTPDFAARAERYPKAVELVTPQGYINTPEGFMLSSLAGNKIVLIDFWTYSCINCQRTIPYLNAWYEKYKNYGFEIVGVHTPEFEFEKVFDNVKAGVEKFGIKYPVVLDNNYATWGAYQNNYWPEHYLMDINGLIVDRHIGEGGYAETEALIQQLLKERALAMGLNITIPSGTVDISQTVSAASPETYFGSGRNEYLGNGTPFVAGTQTLSAPASPKLNTLYLRGQWDFSKEYATSKSVNAHIVYTYSAKSVYFVGMAPQGATLTVLRDGVPVAAERGEDVGQNGTVEVKEARLYKLIEEKSPGTHTLELIIKEPGLEAFTFTFG